MEGLVKINGFPARHAVEIQGRKCGKIQCYIINRFLSEMQERASYKCKTQIVNEPDAETQS